MNLTKENLHEHVDVDPETGCWNWRHGKNPAGYGCVRYGGRTQLAHRVAWELFIGIIPDGLHACHHCDHPPCCNPKHLFLGTDKDNMHDAAKKGRTAAGARHGTHVHPEAVLRGEKHGQSRLTEKDVLAIRAEYAKGELLQRSMACEYGVDQSQISRIVSGKIWKHI